MAEYFRDVTKRDVLLFVAISLPVLCKRVLRYQHYWVDASAVGYQPTLAMKWAHTQGASLPQLKSQLRPTVLRRPHDNDPAPARRLLLDFPAVLSRGLASKNLPAVDSPDSTSTMLHQVW